MLAFAANSLLTRAALADHQIDAGSFAALRLVSGALALFFLAGGASRLGSGSWASACALFGYAAPFSFAYLRLGAGLGALVLFGAVQVTMIGRDIGAGVRPSALGWIGIALALVGMIVLTLPGAVHVDGLGLALMVVAGVAWGAYSLRGRGVARPLAATADNFVRTVPFAMLFAMVFWGLGAGHVTVRGATLAILSGAVASGGGYALWYAVLPRLGATRAAVVQLSVPVIAALGGFLWLDELVTYRWMVSSAATLSGIALVIFAPGRAHDAAPREPGRAGR